MTAPNDAAPTGPASGVPAPTASSRPARALSPRASFWAVLVAFGLASALWSLGNPLMAAVDEPAHMVKAAATVRGQFSGSQAGHPIGVEDFETPAVYAQIAKYAACFQFQWEQPASCSPELRGDLTAASTGESSAARYNPLYYAVVGLPSLVPVGEVNVYLMRVVSGLLAGLGLALAARTVAELRSRSWLVLGVMACLTPAVLYLTSSINPQGIELTGALLIWVALLAILRDPDRGLLARRMGRLAVGTLLLANARGLGPFFLALIVLACVAVAPWGRTLGVLRDRRARIGLALCVAGSLVAVAWIRFGGSLPVGNAVLYPENTPKAVAKYTLARSTEYVEGTLGIFGWLDTFMPDWLYMLVASFILLVAVLGFAVGRRRERIVLLAVVGAVAVLPMAIHVAQAPLIGLFWQGRYILPLAFGVPLIAAFALRSAQPSLPDWVGARLVPVVGLLFVVAHVAAYTLNLHRYVNGFSGGWLTLDERSWVPPLHPAFLIAAFTVSMLLLAEVFRRISLESPPAAPATAAPVDPPADGSASTAAAPAVEAAPGTGAGGVPGGGTGADAAAAAPTGGPADDGPDASAPADPAGHRLG